MTARQGAMVCGNARLPRWRAATTIRRIPLGESNLMSQYSRPTLTDLGQVEDLTQVTVSIKLAVPGTDIHVSKDGVKKVTGGNRGVTINIS